MCRARQATPCSAAVPLRQSRQTHRALHRPPQVNLRLGEELRASLPKLIDIVPKVMVQALVPYAQGGWLYLDRLPRMSHATH